MKQSKNSTRIAPLNSVRPVGSSSDASQLQVALQCTLGYKNHKSCKILPKFSSALHFLQESYKFVQESQILQICYNVEHFLQDSDNIFAKNAFFW